VFVPGYSLNSSGLPQGLFVGTSGDFQVELASGVLKFGIFQISGIVWFQRLSGVFQLSNLAPGSPFSQVAPISLVIPTFPFDLALSILTLKSDGTFDVSATIRSLGNTRLSLSGTSLSVRKTGAGLDTFSVQINGGSIRLPSGATIPVGTLSFNSNGVLPANLNPASFNVGIFSIAPSGVRLRLGNGAAVRFELVNPATITVLGSGLRLDRMTIDSSGTFDSEINVISTSGNLILRSQHTLPATKFNVTHPGDKMVLTLPSSRTLALRVNPGSMSFFTANVTGWVQSDGKFSFTGSGQLEVAAQLLPGENNLKGSVNVKVADGSFSADFTGSGVLNGDSFGWVIGSLNEKGLLHVTASKVIQEIYFDFLSGTWKTRNKTVYGSGDFLLPNGNGSGFFIKVNIVKGYVDGATVFLDANRNGVLDFLDLNGDGLQDPEEPDEPSGTSDANGAVVFALPDEFDSNGNGVVDPEEGLLVALGGLDTSTMLPLEAPLMAPAGSTVMTPLTTLIAVVAEREQISTSAAEALVESALGLPDVSLTTFDAIAETRFANPLAPSIFAAGAMLHDTLVQMGAALAPSAGLSLAESAAAALDAIAQQVGGGFVVDLTNPATVAVVFDNAAQGLGATLEAAFVDGVSAIISAGNQAIRDVEPIADEIFLAAVIHIEAAARRDVAEALGAAATGDITIEDAVQNNTGAALLALIADSDVGSIVPPDVTIDDAALVEGESGTSLLAFNIHLSAASAIPVTVMYQTADGTALEAEGDYLALNGSFTFAPGATTHTVFVEINGDTLPEGNETFFLQLVSSSGARVADFEAAATIIDDDNLPPVAVDDEVSTSELVPVVISVLANDSDAEDSIVPSSLTIVTGPQHGALQVDPETGSIVYTPDVEFSGIDSFRYTVNDEAGAISNEATVTVIVSPLPEKSARLQIDPVEPGLTALVIKGTAGNDVIKVIGEGNTGRVRVMINNDLLGVFSPTGRIIVLGGSGDDDVKVNGRFGVAVEIYGGDDDRLRRRRVFFRIRVLQDGDGYGAPTGSADILSAAGRRPAQPSLFLWRIVTIVQSENVPEFLPHPAERA
jgi:hypothetical protein